MVSRFVITFLGFFSTLNAFALSYDEAYWIMATQSEDITFSYSNHGALCEKLAVAQIQRDNKDAYVVSGIRYAPDGGQIMGELDVVAFDETTGQAFLVVEVKCSKNYNDAARKAEEQLTRFAEVAGNCNFDYYDSFSRYSCSNFQNPNIKYSKLSYSDAKVYGFDLSFGLSRQDILQMIDSL